MASGAHGLIVVGVDGSDASKAALGWALDEASLRDAKVHAVHAWEFPGLAVMAYGPTAVPVITPEDLEKAAHDVLEAAVAEVAGAHPTAALTTSVQRGHPAEVLLEAAKGADLLVVGSRGRGGFSGMLLGSVSTQVAHHASCPVLIVRG